MALLPPIMYRERSTGTLCKEKPFASFSLNLLYGSGWLSRTLGRASSYMTAHYPLFSCLLGRWYKRPASRHLIAPFIVNFSVKAHEFAEPVTSFGSFNAFFIRQLKTAARPIEPGQDVAVIPADGRYLFYSHVQISDSWIIKERKFDLAQLIGNAALAENYQNGTMVIARLCPSDYHRFHFPCDCQASSAQLINGYWHSVHPYALRYNANILVQNKRFVTTLTTENFGTILYLEIGAVGVGSAVQTYYPTFPQVKGAEKGYFEFGASCIVMLFEPNTLTLEADLLAGNPHIETLCLMGQPLGRSSIKKDLK